MNLPHLITRLLHIERDLTEQGIEVNDIKVETFVTTDFKEVIDVYYYNITNTVSLVREVDINNKEINNTNTYTTYYSNII